MAFIRKLSATSLGTTALICVLSASAANLPPRNPYLADSHWPMLHGGSDAQKASPYAGPIAGPGESGRQLREDEISFAATGPIEVIGLNWTGRYPDGRQAILVGTHQHMVKLDGDSLETLSTYVMREGNYISAGDIDRINRRYDELYTAGDYQGLFDFADEIAGSPLRDEHMGNCYAFTNNRNERVFYFRDQNSGKRYLRFFGDAVEGDIESDIVVTREWEIPQVDGSIFIPFAFNMTFDGWIVMASTAGVLMAVSEDLSEYRTIDLAKDKEIDPTLDSISSFVRAGINVDDRNGIIVITEDSLKRVQWTGDGFSLDPADGAWRASYPVGERGSGTTPVLMGFGDDEDNLVLIGDGEADDPHIMLYWRHEIPDDWEGLDGYDRRVAGISLVEWPDGKSRFIVENSPAVMGYGIFATPETPSRKVPDQGSVVKNLIAETLSTAIPGWEAVGGTKWEWDPETRELNQAWMINQKLVASMCSVSRVNELMYCIGRRDGDFTLEAIDWNSGQSSFHYLLGPSLKYFAYNSLVITPGGAVDLHSWFGMGVVRMNPVTRSK